MGLDLYAKIEQYLDFEEEVAKLHNKFFEIIFEKELDNILDIGCGQGIFVNNLSLNGLNAYGIDLSQEQIKIANLNGVKNVEALPLEKVSKKYDCATAVFDVINYIPKAQLKTFFKDTNKTLNSGGYFIFDINSLFGFEEIAQGTLSMDLSEKFIVIDALFEDEKLITDLTMFSQKDDNTYEKEQDSIIQHYHKNSDLETLLNETGFELEKIIKFKLHAEDCNDKFIFISKKL